MSDNIMTINETTPVRTDLRGVYWLLSFAIVVSTSSATWVAITTFKVDNAVAIGVENQKSIAETDKDRVRSREKIFDMMNRIDSRLSRIEGALGVKDQTR